MSRIKVNVSKKYDVIVEKGAINRIAQYAEPVCATNRVALITDEIVDAKYGIIVEEGFRQAEFECFKFVFPNGESSKNINVLSDILEFLAEKQLRRNDTLIALGGGVVGDITGLAAAMYMRGVNMIQVPTTLLAMVDSSVGGKTAIDLKNGKNLGGAFWQPSVVVVDTEIAENLPAVIFAEGMAEVIKCNIIKDLPIIDRIRAGRLNDYIQETIEQCVALKRDVIEQDEFDVKGIRNILNVGHTVAHAIEKLSDYRISHGRAVGTGMIIEAKISKKLGLCNDNTVDAIEEAVKAYNLICDLPWSNDATANAMKSDKKNRDARIVFELPCGLGKCKEVKLDKQEVINCLDAFI